MIGRVAGAVAASLLLAGCVSSDPRQGGFVSGVVGIAGGGYQARIDARERELDALQRHQARLAGRLVGQRSRIAGIEARIAETERRIAILNARAAAGEDLATVRSQIARLTQIREAQRRELADSVLRARREMEEEPVAPPRAAAPSGRV
jgi:septal ring factor EnvC (AmiA/AmiB activator)